jgi:hypothetical protein
LRALPVDEGLHEFFARAAEFVCKKEDVVYESGRTSGRLRRPQRRTGKVGRTGGADPAHSSSEARGVTWAFPGRGREALEAVSSPSESPSPKSRPGQRAPGELPPAIDPGHALSYSLAAIATLFRIEDLSDGKFRTVRTAADIENSASRKDACSLEALGGRHATPYLTLRCGSSPCSAPGFGHRPA